MSATDAIQKIIEAYNNKLTKISAPSVGIQLGLMVALGAAALCAFSVLRPNNSLIYQPKVKYAADEKRPPPAGKGLLDWVKPVWHTKEAEMMQTVGLDAVTYLRFLRMCRNMLITIAALTCAVLLPINLVRTLQTDEDNNLNYLLALTITNVTGNWLWAHVVGTYVITAIACAFIWINWRAIVRLRWQWFRSPQYQEMLSARSLLITQVGKKFQTDNGLGHLLQSLNIPYPTTAVHIGRRVGALPALIEKHNEAVKELEQVLTSYFKDPNRVPTKRPTKRLGGFMGMGGRKVDAVDYLTEKIKSLDERVHLARAQIDERKAENYGFASFETVPYAHIVAKKLSGKRRHNARFELAPQPNDLIWQNLSMSDAARTKNKFFGGILLVLLCGLYTIPLVAVSLLANLAALSAYVDFIDRWISDYPILFSAFVGIVPPILSLLLQMVLPMIIRWIAALQGATTHSQSDRTVTARYSAFLLITQFVIFVLLGTVVLLISQIVIYVQNRASSDTVTSWLRNVPKQLLSAYLNQSNYWLTILCLRGASACFDLAQVVSLVLVWFRARAFGRTPREIREYTKPPIFDYPVYLSNHILIIAVALVYAPLAPLVALFAAGVFAVSTWVYKYQLLYVSVTRSETGGRLWNVAVNRILMGLILMHLFMAVSFALLKSGGRLHARNLFYAIALIPPAVAVIIFKIVLDRQFDDRFRWYIPSEAEMADVHIFTADARKNRLQKRFGHDALSEPLFTPMLHKDVQHLLPTIYSGRIGQGQAKVEGKTVEQNTAGGLTFALMEQHDLAVDRNAWLRERDEDAMTVTTAPMLGGHGGGPGSVGGADEFAAKRAEYLRHGAHMSRSSTPFIGTPEEELRDPYEMQRMATIGGDDARFDGAGTPNASTENLIQYPPQYSSPQGRGSPRMGHKPNFSTSSFSTLGGGGGGYDMGAGGFASGGVDMAQYGAPGGSRSASRGSNHPGGFYPPGAAPGRGTPPHGGHQPNLSQGSMQWSPHHQASRSMQSQGSGDFSRPGSRQDQRQPQFYPPTSSAGGSPYAPAAAQFADGMRGMARTPPAEETLATPTQGMFSVAGAGAPRNPYAPLDPEGSTENLPGALEPRRR
ncbi:hypothetical protein JCM8097_002661 [Rhodosporidiobolus ruineniae]